MELIPKKARERKWLFGIAGMEGGKAAQNKKEKQTASL